MPLVSAIMGADCGHYLTRPYYGSRRMSAWLTTQGHLVNLRQMEAGSRLAAGQYGKHEIFNRDQTCQYTCIEYTSVLEQGGTASSMGGKDRCTDNIFLERLRPSLKYGEVRAYAGPAEAKAGIGAWLRCYCSNHCKTARVAVLDPHRS